MDIKRLIFSMAIMLVLVVGWKLIVEYEYKQHPDWMPQPTADAQPSTAPTTNAVATSTTGPTTSSIIASINAAPSQGLAVVGSDTPAPAEIGSMVFGDPRYAMGLSIDPNGAGLSSVTLNNFYETAERKSLYVYQKPIANLESSTKPLATPFVSINGNKVDLSKVNWTLAKVDVDSATYIATVNDGGAPALEVQKTFQVFPRDTKDGREGFEIRLEQNFRNLSPKAINVSTAMNGPTMPARENDRSEDRQLLSGYDKGYSEVEVGHALVSDFSKSKLTKDMVANDPRAMLWVGTGNSYFNAIVRPEATTANQAKIASAIGTGTNLDAATSDEHNVALVVQSAEFKLDPGATVPFNFRVFFGPKQRALFNNPYYSAFPLGYENTLVITGGFCGFLTFGWLITTLYYILFAFHYVFHDWGLAIIGLVCLVRLILHPITKKSQVNMMSMGKMGPEIEKLKKKYGDNKDELNKAMMQVYKQQGFTPVLGCLPMFLQMPIWIALWSALQSTFDLRQAPFLRFGSVHLTWIKDLSHPDALVHFAQPVPLYLFGWTLASINVLPLCLAVVFFIQQKMQPVPSNQTPEQIQQRKTMQWMSLLFPVMLYAGPSGLNLYIMTSTTIGIFENKIIRKHIKEKEEAEKSGKVIVDAGPMRTNKRNKDLPTAAPKKGGIMGWMADLQAKAEEIRREAERRGKDQA